MPGIRRKPLGRWDDDGVPSVAGSRRIWLWERQPRTTSGWPRRSWEPVTFSDMLAELGGAYDRMTARVIEAMVGGEVAETDVARFRFRLSASSPAP